jgi:thiamine phosphate synthase YjbQ (UPF0047 family)
MVVQESLTYRTQGRRSIELTEDVARIVSRCGVRQGLCHVFVHHTSASLMLCENADPTDMPAHVRSVLTQSALTIPVSEGHCLLGTWQGIYLGSIVGMATSAR